MREIKFRAWIKEVKKLWHFDKNCRNDSYYFSVYEDQICYHCDDPEAAAWSTIDDDIIVMQYTGLKDKNGKEIYEGDIVKHNEENYVIQWDYFGWALCWTICNEMWLSNNEEVEVIGNIYENPELLK